jgi:hypothetical protein
MCGIGYRLRGCGLDWEDAMGEYFIAVVGESFDNDDGTSRQEELRLCEEGDRVSLVRQPDNPRDPNCVAVISANGVQIGNISRDDAWLAERLDRGQRATAFIARLNKGKKGLVGAVLLVDTTPDRKQKSVTKVPQTTQPPGCFGIVALMLVGALTFTSAGDAIAQQALLRD